MPLPPAGDIAIVVAGALVAGFVNGLSGTGYALMALGFWLQAMSPVTAAPLVALCTVCGASAGPARDLARRALVAPVAVSRRRAFWACRWARCCWSMCACSR